MIIESNIIKSQLLSLGQFYFSIDFSDRWLLIADRLKPLFLPGLSFENSFQIRVKIFTPSQSNIVHLKPRIDSTW